VFFNDLRTRGNLHCGDDVMRIGQPGSEREMDPLGRLKSELMLMLGAVNKVSSEPEKLLYIGYTGIHACMNQE